MLALTAGCMGGGSGGGTNTGSTNSASSSGSNASSARMAMGPASGQKIQSPPPVIVYFASGSTALSAADKAMIDQSLGTTNYPYWKFSVTGHADRANSAAVSMTLSQAHAAAVTDYMVSKGILRSQINTQSRGEASPRVPTADGISEQKNRRVEVFSQIQ